MDGHVQRHTGAPNEWERATTDLLETAGPAAALRSAFADGMRWTCGQLGHRPQEPGDERCLCGDAEAAAA